ncbi:MAG: ATP-binding protein [Acidobacteria bacterium]|nr:ATP-binding protein [Acidobacteriota bacterium]
MKEMVVISGKGGTGKTSLTASLASLSGASAIADCDVDASDLHLVLSPEVQRLESFKSGHEAVIRQDDCIACGTCMEKCRFNAVHEARRYGRPSLFKIDPLSCEGCGVCVRLCPEKAIDFPERTCGQWMVSETRYGPLVHARLAIGAENSGKLVSIVKNEARRIAKERDLPWIIVDGPPGIACPVIASITGASLALVVVEPTLSGKHDMERVFELTKHFDIPTLVVINKWEINPGIAGEIERGATSAGVPLAGKISYDNSVTAAQIKGIPVVEYGGPAARDIREIWHAIERRMESIEKPSVIEV